METNERTRLIIECERLKVFLSRNQLVQANAISQKIEGILLDLITREAKPETIESHPYWTARRAAHNAQNEILGGFTQKAEAEASSLAEMLRKKEPEK